MKRIDKCARISWEIFRNRYLSFVFRSALGVVFIISGAGKLPESAEFVQEVEDADVLPHALATVYGNALPFVEIVIGALLILGLLSRFAAGIGGLSALSFIIGNGFSSRRKGSSTCW